MHYGHGPVAVCGVARMTSDAKVPGDKCVRCLYSMKRESSEKT